MATRNLLRANAVLSTSSGLAALLAAAPLADAFGISRPGVLMILGGALMVYGLEALLTANRFRMRRGDLLFFAWADAAWVAGSAALLVAAPDLLSLTGRSVVTTMAGVVAAFAIAQFRAARRIGGAT